MTPAPAPRIYFPSIRFTPFDRMARVNHGHQFDALDAELISGVWRVTSAAAEALRVQA